MKNLKVLMLIFTFFSLNNAKAQNSVNAINQVLQSYLGVEEALFKDKGEAANVGAKTLVNNIADINPSKLNTSEKKSWTAYGEKLRFNAQHISESKSIDHQREHFVALSDAMYGLLKTFKTHPTIYRQYCPMKKQYWLNASKEIQNPYYGKQMPDCGKVTETMTGRASVMMLN